MNLQALRKNVGESFRVRPKPYTIDGAGDRLNVLDDLWQLQKVDTSPNRDEPHEEPEQFCPPCARKRGIGVPLPEGMTEEVLFSDTNPTFHYHLGRVLQQQLLRALGADMELRAMGVSSVGAIVTGRSITLLLHGAWPGSVEVPLVLRKLEAIADTEAALVLGLKAAIAAALATPPPS